MIMWCMRITCWIPKAIHTQSEYVILIAFTLQKWLHERASVLRYTYIACLVFRLLQMLIPIHKRPKKQRKTY